MHGLGGPRIGVRRDQRAGLVEAFGLQLVPELQVRPFGDRAVFRPHVDRVAAGVAERVGKANGGAVVQGQSLLSGNHASC